MKLTNKFNLPETFVNVIRRPQYTRGDAQISVTELLSPTQLVQLRAKHGDSLESDVSEMIWSLFGTAVHNILEHGKGDNHIVEERLHTELNDWKISGAIDLQEVEEDGIIVSDYKVTGVWSVMAEKEEWVSQLNMYAWLVERCKGLPVKKIQIVAIVRDWQAREVDRKEGYPPSPVVVLDIDLWPFERREQYIKDRLDHHNEGFFAAGTGTEYPECTPAEMWEKKTVYAIKKKGAARAKNLYGDKEEAYGLLEELGDAFEVEVREGERTRCEKYCPVSPFCKQYKQYKESK
jgi:hypothetical protein